MRIRAHLFISGRVQGVFFRSNTKKIAQEFGLNGWVKNLPNGGVEVMVEGEEDGVGKLVRWCQKGPSFAEVTNVEKEYETYKGRVKGFEIRY